MAVVMLAAVLAFSMAAQRPDPVLTPGVVRNLSRSAVCGTAWGKDRRHVTEAMKRATAAAYGVDWSQHAKYEFDHLIPRELGGADDVRNLWPESWTSTPFNAHKKDRLENRLHRLVCTGSLSLADAQQAIRTDWIAAYGRYVEGR